MGAIGLLHLTDFHQGMTGQKALWPLLKYRFYEDLRELHDRAGPWHAIVFTGDLTQKGTKEEFIALDRTLDELRDHLRKLGSDPVLLAVPGNHDLVRPDRTKPEVAAAIDELSNWPELPELRDGVLGKSAAIASQVVHESFANYHDWWLRRCDRRTAICSAPIKGCMPGDFASSLTVDDLSVVVVGFNTSYLQLHGGVTEGQLAIDRQQMLALAEDPYRMIKEHDVALLLTHHPRSWLHPRARDCFDEEFNSPGIFTAHLFGHMHEAYMDERRDGGASARRSIQGKSLFGLEHYEVKGKNIERLHGYSAIRIVKSDKNNRLQIWPRSYEKNTAAAYRRMVPDLTRYDVDANHCVELSIQSDLALSNEAPAHTAADSHAVDGGSVAPEESSYALPRAFSASHVVDASRTKQIESCLSAARERVPLVAGTRLGSYLLVRRLGYGRFSDVWAAEDTAIGREFAVKIFIAQRFPEQDQFVAAERFCKGAAAMATLSHESIVSLQSTTYISGPFIWFCMNIYADRDLGRALSEKRLSAEECVSIYDDLLAAVSYSHSKGVKHRDIRPTNVLLRRDLQGAYHGVLADFDMAYWDNLLFSTKTSMGAVGLPRYLPDELLRTGRDHPEFLSMIRSEKNDVYALSVLLIDMFIGEYWTVKHATVRDYVFAMNGSARTFRDGKRVDAEIALRVAKTLERVLSPGETPTNCEALSQAWGAAGPKVRAVPTVSKLVALVVTFVFLGIVVVGVWKRSSREEAFRAAAGWPAGSEVAAEGGGQIRATRRDFTELTQILPSLLNQRLGATAPDAGSNVLDASAANDATANDRLTIRPPPTENALWPLLVPTAMKKVDSYEKQAQRLFGYVPNRSGEAERIVYRLRPGRIYDDVRETEAVLRKAVDRSGSGFPEEATHWRLLYGHAAVMLLDCGIGMPELSRVVQHDLSKYQVWLADAARCLSIEDGYGAVSDAVAGLEWNNVVGIQRYEQFLGVLVWIAVNDDRSLGARGVRWRAARLLTALNAPWAGQRKEVISEIAELSVDCDELREVLDAAKRYLAANEAEIIAARIKSRRGVHKCGQ